MSKITDLGDLRSKQEASKTERLNGDSMTNGRIHFGLLPMSRVQRIPDEPTAGSLASPVETLDGALVGCVGIYSVHSCLQSSAEIDTCARFPGDS